MNYCVVANAELQHSIWPNGKALPAGWALQGFSGTKDDCLDYISKVWVDIRPLSIIEPAR